MVSETIVVGKNMQLSEELQMSNEKKITFGMGPSGSIQLAADDKMEFSGSGGFSFSGSLDLGSYGIQAGQAAFAATTVTSLSVSDGNITNVGDIALDSISADGNDIDFSLTDNRSAALEIKEGSTAYMTFDTTDGQEGILVGKEMELQEGALVADDKTLSSVTTMMVASSSYLLLT